MVKLLRVHLTKDIQEKIYKLNWFKIIHVYNTKKKNLNIIIQYIKAVSLERVELCYIIKIILELNLPLNLFHSAVRTIFNACNFAQSIIWITWRRSNSDKFNSPTVFHISIKDPSLFSNGSFLLFKMASCF